MTKSTDKELTVEECLAELREMFPTGYIEIAQGIGKDGQQYFEFRGSSTDRWTPRRCGETLADVMAQVREWKAQQK